MAQQTGCVPHNTPCTVRQTRPGEGWPTGPKASETQDPEQPSRRAKLAPGRVRRGLRAPHSCLFRLQHQGRSTISYHFWYNFLSHVFCPYFAVFCRIFRNTLYSAVFRKYRFWAKMTFRILSVFLNYERIHQNTLKIHVKYVFLKSD